MIIFHIQKDKSYCNCKFSGNKCLYLESRPYYYLKTDGFNYSSICKITSSLKYSFCLNYQFFYFMEVLNI